MPENHNAPVFCILASDFIYIMSSIPCIAFLHQLDPSMGGKHHYIEIETVYSNISHNIHAFVYQHKPLFRCSCFVTIICLHFKVIFRFRMCWWIVNALIAH